MIKNFFSFLKVFIFGLLIFAAVYFDWKASFVFGNNFIDLHVATIIFICGSFLYFYKIAKKLVCKMFFCKSKSEKGLDNLQLALYGMLLKDRALIEKSTQKSKKYLGNIPIVSWLEGQQNIINGDESRAKAIFYSMCEREKNTALGAYSLYQLAVKEKSDTEVLNAVNLILRVSSSQDLILQAIAIAIKNNNFTEARARLSSIKKSSKSRLIEAVIYSEEGCYKKDIALLKKSFKLAPELSDIAIRYANILIEKDEYSNARSVLKKSFKISPSQKVFDTYILADEDLSNLDKINLAKKLTIAAPESWIGHFGLAKLLVQEGMFGSAFQNLLTAYEKEQYDFIKNDLIKVAESLDHPKPEKAVEILSQPLESKSATFIWKCANCGTEEINWVPICRCCNKIAEYQHVQTGFVFPVSNTTLI